MTQLDLLDALAARDEAIDRAGQAAPVEWLDAALVVVDRLARTLSEFTTDDVWDALTTRPPEPRALGAVMTRAKAAGLAVPTDRTRQSRRAECHARPLRIWKAAR